MDVMRVKTISDAAAALYDNAISIGYDKEGAQLCVDNLVSALNRGLPEGLFFHRHNDGSEEDLVLMTTETFTPEEEKRAMAGIEKAWKTLDQDEIWA